MKLSTDLIKTIFIAMLLVTSIAHASSETVSPPFSVIDGKKQPLAGELNYLEDPSGSYTFEQVISGRAGQFKPLVKKGLGFGYKPVMWIRFAADFSNYHDPFWFFMQGYEHVGELTLYYPTKDEKYESKQMIEKNPAAMREFATHNYIFKSPDARIQNSYLLRALQSYGARHVC